MVANWWCANDAVYSCMNGRLRCAPPQGIRARVCAYIYVRVYGLDHGLEYKCAGVNREIYARYGRYKFPLMAHRWICHALFRLLSSEPIAAARSSIYDERRHIWWITQNGSQTSRQTMAKTGNSTIDPRKERQRIETKKEHKRRTHQFAWQDTF